MKWLWSKKWLKSPSITTHTLSLWFTSAPAWSAMRAPPVAPFSAYSIRRSFFFCNTTSWWTHVRPLSCVCVCVYVYVCIYIIYIYVCMYVCIHLLRSLQQGLFVAGCWGRLRVRAFVCVCVCVCVCWEAVCKYTYTYIRIHTSMYISLSLSLSLCIHKYTNVCTYICRDVSIYLYM